MRNAPTVSSSPAQIRDTSLLEIHDPPSATTRSSTLRVETPWTYASITTAYSAWSTRLRGSRMLGKKLPARSFGIASWTSPAWVVNSRGRTVALGRPGAGRS